MAKLLKLYIAGIRSFGPHEDHVQQLKFASPLTLIVGQNGCGKTTIIEAIRFACTDELPEGTNSGRGFANDPKMGSGSVTKGQIRLKILDPKGNEVTIVKVVELAQLKASLKFSRKSSSLRIVKPDGSELSVAQRCADITSECCRTMNVTASVLNNVIFCHQENSLWPLEEGQKLKEKFDDIFDAKNYNDVSDLLRKLHKEKLINIKLLKEQLAGKNDKNEAVDRDKRRLEDRERKLESFEGEMVTKTEEIKPIIQRIDEIMDLENNLGNLQRQLAAKEENKKGIIEQQNTIKGNIAEEFVGTDEDLQNKIGSFKSDRQDIERKIQELEQRKLDIVAKSKEIAAVTQNIQQKIGELTQVKTQYEKWCFERQKLINKAKLSINIKKDIDFSAPENAKLILNEFNLSMAIAKTNFNKLITDKELEEQVLQEKVDEMREASAEQKERIVTWQNHITQAGIKIKNLHAEMKKVKMAMDISKINEDKAAAAEQNIFDLQQTFNEQAENTKIQDYRKEIRVREEQLEKLELDCRILQQNDVTEARIESEKETIQIKQNEIINIKSKHSENFRLLLRGKVPGKGIKNSIDAILKTENILVKNIMEKISNKQKDVTTLEVQYEHQQKKLEELEDDLRMKQQKITEACNGSSLDDTVEQSYDKRERLQRDKGQYNAVKIIYEQFLNEFQKSAPCCPVCETNFNGKLSAVKNIVANIQNKIDRVPKQLRLIEGELDKEEEFYSNLQQLRLVNDDVEQLNSETLPEARKELSEIHTKLQATNKELDDLKAKLKNPQETVDICNKIISDVTSLEQNFVDVERLEESVKCLAEQVVTVASSKSKHEIEIEIDGLKEELSELRRKVDAQQKKIDSFKDKLQRLTHEKSVYIEKQNYIKSHYKTMAMCDEEMKYLTEVLESTKLKVAEGAVHTLGLDAEFAASKKNKEEAVQMNKLLIKIEREKIGENEKIINDIKKLQSDIDVYLNNDVEKQLTTMQDKLTDNENKNKVLNDTNNKILEAISKMKEDIAKEEINLRNLKDNVILREKQRVEAKITSEIQELKARIGDYNYKNVYEEKKRLELNRQNLESEMNKLSGQKNELTAAINELKTDLAKPENRNAYTEYMNKLYELKVEQHSCNDIKKYNDALEKSILQFHKSRMVQINQCIRELWREIYCGNDIDYIEIKTEYATSTTSKRAYNYKVVQVKKGVELDMRGRCSAGQKVLACLVIRMALAETLSTNCGILALDEPTTNLDKENIKSLCDALSKFVTRRHNEKNFQLIIITHDEEFLNTITRIQGVSHYYRISRNDDGFSMINKEYSNF